MRLYKKIGGTCSVPGVPENYKNPWKYDKQLKLTKTTQRKPTTKPHGKPTNGAESRKEKPKERQEGINHAQKERVSLRVQLPPPLLGLLHPCALQEVQ